MDLKLKSNTYTSCSEILLQGFIFYIYINPGQPLKYMKRAGSFYKMMLIVTIVTFTGCQKTYKMETDRFLIEFGSKGNLLSLKNKENGYDYLSKEDSSFLLSLRIGGKIYKPISLSASGDILLLNYTKKEVSAKIKAVTKDSYFTFDLMEISDKDKVELIQWGPFKTSIKETVGETVGVVRDTAFAIGIQALNPRTLGGSPENEDDSFTGYDIFATTSLVDVSDSVHILYRGNTARPEQYGSSLTAYTRSRTKERIVSSMQNEKYTAPAFDDEGIEGSEIALFGCKPDEALNVIEKIELAEGLPHPLLDGVWAKRSKRAVSAYLIQDFTHENYRQAIDLTRKAGLNYLYHGDPFLNWGHFALKNDMKWDELAAIVDEAESQGIRVGAHILSNFITTNDPYVTPVPDKRLAKVGSAVLTDSISDDETTIGISDPAFFNQMQNNTLHAAIIGRELVRYDKVSESEPWQLLGCERGAFGTFAGSFSKGDTISKLADHAYKVFLTDNDLSAEMASRIADLYNKTGLKQISFDGLEGNSSTGMGKYGELLFVKNWYDRLIPEIKNDYIMDASTPGHYFWHMFTRMNWGEPWYAGFRESQTEYRLLNQDYFRRNYIPCMLGWFSMRPSTSIEDIEWMLARSAAFDAGYALVTNASVFKNNGYGDQILEKIREWEKARMSGAFNSDQKKRMEKIKNEFTLKVTGKNKWNLIPYEVKRYEHEFRDHRPGETGSSKFTFNNPYTEQNLGFILTVKDGPVEDISITIDSLSKTVLHVVLRPGQNLKYEGGDEVRLYSENWQPIRTLRIKSDAFRIGHGDHDLSVNCIFPSGNKGILKLEIKTSGQPEPVGSVSENEIP
ncbi:MAG TPA: hypothetical protein DEO60_06450 [Bacteroidales bacterium]|nr:hypothetical protein [Bacteroidales bacterium]